MDYDLLVLGGSAQGLSTAILAQQSGANSVRIIETTQTVAYPDLVGKHKLEVSYGDGIKSISLEGDSLKVETVTGSYLAKTCVIALNSPDAIVALPAGVETNERVHAGPETLTSPVLGHDILVVGDNDRAVVLASKYIDEGARSVVLAARGMNPDVLSETSREEISKLEKNRQLTVLYRATPKDIYPDTQDLPMVTFGDNRTPDLVFDHVVFAATQSLMAPEQIGIGPGVLESGRVLYVRDPRLDPELPSATCPQALIDLAPFLESLNADRVRENSRTKRDYKSAPSELREEFYNATITHFEPTHSDLWVLRVKPDIGDISHKPGQYTSLGLGFWEDRIDDALESDIDAKWDKRVLRSYSISNRIFNDQGYLASETENGELEFYIVLVPPRDGNVPGLTPRLALKRPGDRIFMGSKTTGRYTLAAIDNPNATVVFLSTGAGEAPHNSMIVELLRNGHQGKIISAVSVRNWKDLGYLDQHRQLEAQFPNYKYLPMPTRETNVPKRYIQETIESGELEEVLGATLDPKNTHVYMCGNPSMIGAPDHVDGVEVLPKSQGAVGLLLERGFKIDARKEPGNVHFETYW